MGSLSKIEWEFIQEDIELIKDYEISSNIDLTGVSSCIIKRNEKYDLILDVEGSFVINSKELNVKYDVIYFVFENNDEKITANFCVFNKQRISVENGVGFHQFLQFKVYNIEREYKNKDLDSLSKVKEWYLNGPSESVMFARRTLYFNDFPFKVHEFEKDNYEIIESVNGVSYNHSLIQLDNCKFVLEKVNDFGPKWSNNLCIEYQNQFNIPSSEIRQKIKEILSFSLGKNLIKIGESYYDEDNNILKEISFLPNISPRIDIKRLCSSYEVPAISFYGDFIDEFYFENQLSKIISAYLNETELNLSHILEYLYVSTGFPTESEIILIGGCLDELAEIWFDSSKTCSNGELIKEDEYCELMNDELPIIKDKLKCYLDVYENIKKSYEITGYQKVKKFLDEIGLEQGRAEKKARGHRNISAHGHVMPIETRLKMVYTTDIYRTFINRIILRLLNQDIYFDLTSFTELPITEKLPNKDFRRNYKEIKKFYSKIFESD